MSVPFKIGFGFDVHALAESEDMVIGGCILEHHKGTVGHSDADVLLHAICDAMLGALALGDIGYHFPDNDPKYKGIDSAILTEHVVKLIHSKGWKVGNIDSTVALQQPKLKPHIPAMRSRIAQLLQVDVDCVGVKATTTEKLGFEGREEGVSAYSSVLLYKD